MRGDLGKMEQIISNLVGNAIKFTRQGGVSVRLSRLGGVDAADILAVAVRDTGVGVPTNKLERIFRAFEQADGTTSRQFGGTGLGLSISLRLAQLQGGDISVSSVEGEGSTFTLSLPLSPPLPANDAAAMPPPASWSPASFADASFAGDRARIGHRYEVVLVVEDDDAFASILCDLTRKRGFKCVRATDGRTGLELAALHRPIGILLDIGLPELDGWSVMSLLK
jgi:CheY-like chemotaxis protein